jgi:hypothetical protein
VSSQTIKKTNSNARNPAREAGSTIIKKQTTCNALKPAKWLKLDRHLVGDNNNKVTAPNLIIYRRLLLKTPTRAVHAKIKKHHESIIQKRHIAFAFPLSLCFLPRGLCPHKPSKNKFQCTQPSPRSGFNNNRKNKSGWAN